MRNLLLLIVAFVALYAAPASAQVTVNPAVVQFQASPSDGETWLDGSAKVTEYKAVYFFEGVDPATGTPVATVSLGHPTKDASGKISVSTVDLATLFQGLGTGVVYKAVIDTVGPSGSRRSDTASNPFGFETRTVPAPASAVAVSVGN